MTGEPRWADAVGPRLALARLLTAVPTAHLAAVARDLFDPALLPAPIPWRDNAAVVDAIGAMPRHDGEPSPLLLFVARVAQELSGSDAAELRRWLTTAAGAEGPADTAAARPLYQLPPSVSPQTGSSAQLGTVRSSSDPRPPSTSGDSILISRSAMLHQPSTVPPDQREHFRIWGGVPLRNPDFTGRESLLLRLQRALESRSKASVLPEALHGLGGVGKTQLAVEFAYRFADRYDIVWWIPAEQQPLVLQSLFELGRRLGTPATENLQQGASLVLETLSGTALRWLLIYDNANDPDDIAQLIPSAGGHVLLTSRNQSWSNVWDAIEVDVFDRRESVELVRKRGAGITTEDADRLAARLGDLPLALDQAASWQAATSMSVEQYLELFDRHVAELLSEGKPTSYPTTIAALVKLAFQRLRKDSPAVAQLLEMFAYLGAEPISVGLLRRGRGGRISAPLSRELRDPISLGRVIRDLKRYGMAKVDPDQRIQVHRLFQLVLRESLTDELARQSRGNVQELLAAANPGEPDDRDNWSVHAEIGPHVGPAGLIEADSVDARRVVLDQVRYLWVTGDNEGSRRLGESAVALWSGTDAVPDLGPDGELTLIATRHLATALRSLGVNERARKLSEETWERLVRHPEFGPDHEHALATAGVVAVGQRVAGRFREALATDTDNLTRHLRRFGDDHFLTLQAHGNLAVNLRMLSDFGGAHDIDLAVVRTWQKTVSENDDRLLFVQTNLARDLYGLGRYAEALDLQRRILPVYSEQLGAHHPRVLLAERTLAITLRKTGQYRAAEERARQHYHNSVNRYGPEHEHSLAATMTYANTLRAIGELRAARELAHGAIDTYRRSFGEDHPLSLAASVNYAILLRGMHDIDAAHELDERTYATTRQVLGEEHGYTLCAASALGNDHAAHGDHERARRLSAQTWEISQASRGERHPYTLFCAVNAGLDLIATGQPEKGRELLRSTVETLAGALGPTHPETLDAVGNQRAECDIEPPPT